MQPLPVRSVEAGQFDAQIAGAFLRGGQLPRPVQARLRRGARMATFRRLSRHGQLAHVSTPRRLAIDPVPADAIPQQRTYPLRVIAAQIVRVCHTLASPYCSRSRHTKD